MADTVSEELLALLRTHNLRADVKSTPVQIPVGFAQVTISYRRYNDPEPMNNTFGVKWSAPDHDAVASSAALSWAAAFTPNGFGNGFHGISATAKIAEEGSDPTIQIATLNWNGTQAGFNYTSSNTNYLIKKVTNKGGRPHTGRMFAPFLLESDVDQDGLIAPAAVAQQQGFWDNFFSFLADTVHGPSTPMVILHSARISGILPGPTDVATLIVEQLAATQRRRMRH